MKIKVPAVALLILLASASVFALLMPIAEAADVEITSVSPSSQQGKVGEEIRVTGTINTTDGRYQIWFGSDLVADKTASGNSVDLNFTVPELPGGDYNITLVDVGRNLNATTWFYLETAYYIEAVTPELPRLLQEGDSVVLNVTVTGGEPDTVYYADITVQLPEPLSTNYSALLMLPNTANTGKAYASITFPDAALFQPSGSHTNYTGLYTVYFNKTQNLSETEFFIGFTGKSEYHREEFVEVRAIGYQPNERATIAIMYEKTGATLYSEAVNVSEAGIASTMWLVPWNASIGNYNITITSENIAKPIRDSQFFSVPGYQIEVHSLNLAGTPVAEVLVEATDEATNSRFGNISDKDGTAHLWLEKGNHTLEAFWEDVKVGETHVLITGKSAHNITCELSTMKILVKDETEKLIPFVNLNITYQYVTTKESRLENGSLTGQTDILGEFYFNSALPDINYTVNASRYGLIFNAENNTVLNLPAEPVSQITILCPVITLSLRTSEYHGAPLANAHVEVIEQTSGTFYSGATDHAGVATINCAFGKYKVRVYINEIMLNETVVELFNDTNRDIHCSLYNLTVSLNVVDYFGQPIPNANVTLRRESMPLQSTMTLSNGVATFNNVIGGTTQIEVNLPSQPRSYVAMSRLINEPAEIEIKLDKYVILGGVFIETSHLATLTVVLAMGILVLCLEIYRRRGQQGLKKSGS
ncbi:MAG: carboxypeptidase-like regulatory domain-containing protein [Candidatus Bathycorpusculaceae bacterium]